jgi:hypothetical protein
MALSTFSFRTLTLLALLLAARTIAGQSLEQWTTWGDASMARGEHYGASRYYDGALTLEPGRMSLQWKQAEACRLSNQYDRAAALYDKVQRKDMGRTYPEALRWLGEMQLSMGAYDDAERTWNKVLQKEKDKRSVLALRATNALAGIQLARAVNVPPSPVELEHLTAPINTYDSEFGARIGPDSALYFTSLRGALNPEGEVLDPATYRTRIFRSTGVGDQWNEPGIMDPISGQGDLANPTWTLSSQWMLFTLCPDDGPCRIHYSPFNATDIIATPLEGLGEAMSTQPMVVRWEDREMLLFVSDREGGQGGTDIWQARLENGRAVEVYPLGASVNSPGNERSPWYDTLSQALWFSSDHLPGLGGYDIFTATLENDVFTEAINAGVPINSPANDLYPAIFPERGEGWLTSNRVGSFAAKGETCCNDLYRWTLSGPRTGPVALVPDSTSVVQRTLAASNIADIRRRFPLKLYFHNDEPEPRSWAVTTAQDYGTTYTRYKKLVPDYLRDQKDPKPLEDFFREEVDGGFQALGELVEVLTTELEQGASITLDVRGHASPLASNDYNRNLSSRRIESLRQHLRMLNDGVLAPYLNDTATNGAMLQVRELPFGEERSVAGVSDDIGDLQRSVYSVEAARERRIEVIAVDLVERTLNTTGTIQITQDLGNIQQDQERAILFPIRNEGSRPLRLLESTADCGCTTAELPEQAIRPGTEIPVSIHFSGRAPLGSLKRTVTITTDGVPSKVELIILGTVIP